MNSTDVLNIQHSLVKNFIAIQSKIDGLLKTEILDIKQISDLERFINMQDSILDSMHTMDSIVKGEF